PLRKCYNIPKKECLYYHMNQCLGPCIINEKIDYSDYKLRINRFLNGDAKEVIDSLRDKMLLASENLEFEKAVEYRDLITSIENTIAKQKISINDLTSRDYIGIYLDDEDISINIIITRLGNIVQNHQTIISNINSSDDVISYLHQFYELNDKPKEISITGMTLDLLEEALNINIVDAKIGKKKEILDMALYNAKFNLENSRNMYRNKVLKKKETIDELGSLLGIPTPYRIEAFDNSNLFGEYPVSAMVCYINGVKAPKEYRKYRIKTVDGPNDYESMKEVIYRRYLRLLMEDSKLPDLIVMDGGQIQVHAALDVLQSLNLDIPVMGIQKDDNHKATIIFYDEKLIPIDKNSNVFLLLRDISQTVHDFAISFYRSSKTKGIFSSILDDINGLGPKKKEQLLKHFITIDKIKNASISELMESGINEALATNIYKYFNEESTQD
ncbi:MAG: excinuclease ABC subunit C, partial [Acholeplasmatales bacterium]|nr:excinuclease ABC subunit C [Acholeplasmatales bacterium]